MPTEENGALLIKNKREKLLPEEVDVRQEELCHYELGFLSLQGRG